MLLGAHPAYFKEGVLKKKLDPAVKTMSLTTMPTSRFGFSIMWGKFCHSCYEVTARTALAQFGHFTLKTRIWFQKLGALTPQPPWVRHSIKLYCILHQYLSLLHPTLLHIQWHHLLSLTHRILLLLEEFVTAHLCLAVD